MAKLMCSKVSHNPYKEEMVTEIPEKAFYVDGYNIAERLLEGIPFTVYFDDSGVKEVKIENDYYRDYFEGNFNTKRWYKEVELYAQDIIEEGDEVSLPGWLEEKYFKNGINCAYIIP